MILRASVVNVGDKRADDVRLEFSAPSNTPYSAAPQPGISDAPGPQLGRIESTRRLLGAEDQQFDAFVYGWRVRTLPPGQEEDWYVMLFAVDGLREVKFVAQHDEAEAVSVRRFISFDERGAVSVLPHKP